MPQEQGVRSEDRAIFAGHFLAQITPRIKVHLGNTTFTFYLSHISSQLSVKMERNIINRKLINLLSRHPQDMEFRIISLGLD